MAVHPNGQQFVTPVSVGYNAESGEIWVGAPAGAELMSINIESAAGIFTGTRLRTLVGVSTHADSDHQARFGSSFGSLSFGTIAQPALSEEFVANDLTVVDSLAGGGDLSQVDVDLIYVPEPTSAVLASVALVTLVLLRANHSSRRTIPIPLAPGGVRAG